ncbi:tetratricopeptide repeat protein [Pseudomonas gingeri]|uniref:tetratricopeptide repeat protein n=1 Tax=Pseudomonas gingeri TaxID=117681 RepID=UPI0015A0B71C|nr:tetratricopeptide repeat protein [Pseudomonas gingeri]NWD70560.1 tetratricopeptide repeat protein [Pseudomonas gingeri]
MGNAGFINYIVIEFEIENSMISRRLGFLIFAILSLVVLCSPFLNNPLVFDDEPFFRQGGPAEIIARGISLSPRLWVYDTLAGSFLFLSDKILWLRVESLFFHCCTALVLFGLIRQLLNSLDHRRSFVLSADTAAFVAAFLFAIHPLAILTQGYLIQRTIVCATLFGLLGLWTFWQGLCGKRWALWTSCLCLLLSIYAKEHAVMLPALCFLLWVLHRRSQLSSPLSTREIFSALAVQALVSISIVLWVKGVIGHAYEDITGEMLADEVSLPQGSLYSLSLLNQMGLFFKYLSILLLPQGSSMGLDLRVPFPLSYGVWWLWAGLVGFVAYGVAAFLLLMRGGSKGLLGFSLLFPWVLFATELVSVRLQEAFVLYRSYLWIPGLFIALAMGLRRLKRFYIVTLIPVFALYLFGLSYDRLMSLSAPYFVWNDAAQYLESQGNRPGIFGGYRIYYNLGNAYFDNDFIEQALKNYDISIALKPSYSYAYHQRGRAFLKLNELEKARVNFEQSIKLKPDYAKPYLGMADVFKGLGKADDAQHYLEIGCSKGSQPACDRAHPKRPLMLAPQA